MEFGVYGVWGFLEFGVYGVWGLGSLGFMEFGV